MERLRLILEHEDLSTTMRYAHLAPDSSAAPDLAAVSVDLTMPAGKVIPLAPPARGARVARKSGGGIGTVEPPSSKEVA